MDRDRFSLETIVYLIVGLVFLGIFITYHSAAFPTAGIRLDVTRDEARKTAADYLEARGYDLSGYEHVTTFGADDMGALFLQRTQGMERANEMMREGTPIWRWRSRWFKSGEKEEYRVFVAPSGKVVRSTHMIEDDKAGATLAQDEAADLASRFLSDVARVDLSRYERVEARTKTQTNRADHYFEWKLKGFEVPWKEGDPESGPGTLRISTWVKGDEVTHVEQWLKTPEDFARDHKMTLSEGALLGLISVVLTFLIGVAALVVFIRKYKQDAIRWRFALVFTITIAALYLLASVNAFPVAKATYPTDISYGVFIGILVAGALLVAAIYGLLILLTGASGESLAREVCPKSVGTLEGMIQGRRFTRSFFFSSIRGYALGFFFLGYITLFYIFGREHLGVFVPAQGPYSNLLGLYLPWLVPLAISLLAAVSEEFVFRLFAISFLKRYLKWTVAAVLLPAVIWAFAHSGHPIFPVYVRGIELTIGGVIFGFFFLRFNIMTCIVAHYVIDAIIIGLPLLKSGNTYYVVSGIIVCLLTAVPLVLGIPGVLRPSRDNDAGRSVG